MEPESVADLSQPECDPALRFNVSNNTLYACDWSTAVPRLALDFHTAHAGVTIVACTQSSGVVALLRSDDSTILFDIAALRDICTQGPSVIALTETADAYLLHDSISYKALLSQQGAPRTLPIAHQFPGHVSAAVSLDGGLIALRIMSETMCSGKRVPAEKVKVINLSDTSKCIELPDAFVTTSSLCFSRKACDSSRYLVAARAQRPQDSLPYVYTYAIVVEQTGDLTFQSKQRLTVVCPTSVGFAPNDDLLVCCGARTNVYAFTWAQTVVLSDPVDVPMVCPLKLPVFTRDGQLIYALQDTRSEHQLLTLRRVGNSDFVLHAVHTLPGPAIEVSINGSHDAVVQLDFGYLMTLPRDTETSATETWLISFVLEEKEALLYTRADASEEDLQRYLNFLGKHEFDTSRAMARLKSLISLDSGFPDHILSALATICKNHTTVHAWIHQFWTGLQHALDTAFTPNSPERVCLPVLTLDDTSSRLRLTSISLSSVQADDSAAALSQFVQQALMPTKAVLPSLIANARLLFKSKQVAHASLASFPSAFAFSGIWLKAVPACVARVMRAITSTCAASVSFLSLDDLYSASEFMPTSLYVSNAVNSPIRSLFLQQTATLAQHISAAVSALVITLKAHPINWSTLFWDAWLASYSMLLVSSEAESSCVYPTCWPLSAFAVEQIINQDSISALLLGTTPLDTSGKQSVGVGFNARGDATLAIRGMKKYGFCCDGDSGYALLSKLGVAPVNMIRTCLGDGQLGDVPSQFAWLPYSISFVDFVLHGEEKAQDDSASECSRLRGDDAVNVAVFWQDTSDTNALLVHLIKPSADSVFARDKIRSFPPPNEHYAQAQLLTTAPKPIKDGTGSPTKSPRDISPPKPRPGQPKFERRKSADVTKPSERSHPMTFLRDLIVQVKQLKGVTDNELLISAV